MELVANLWPIVDSRSHLILRFAARAYAMESDDLLIASTLKSLAHSDYILARQFLIPKCLVLTSEHGKIPGVVTAADFNVLQATIAEEALRTLETEMPVLQGVGVDTDGEMFQRRIPVSFPNEPFFVVTFLIEDTAGNLRVYSPA